MNACSSYAAGVMQTQGRARRGVSKDLGWTQMKSPSPLPWVKNTSSRVGKSGEKYINAVSYVNIDKLSSIM